MSGIFTGIFSSKVLNGILLYEVKGMSGSFSSDCKVLIRKAKYLSIVLKVKNHAL